MGKHWHVGLCDCCSYCNTCLISFCCFPPIGSACLQAKAVSIVTGEGACMPCCLTLCCCIGCAINRGNIRAKLDIGGGFIGDCCTWLFCTCCAAVQEMNEVKKRENT